MRWKAPAAAAVIAALLAGCASTPSGGPPPPPPGPGAGPILPDWQASIREYDRDRLARLGEAWETALDQAIRDGHREKLRALGNLPDPDAALRDPLPPPGNYRCRTVKLGARPGGPGLSFVSYNWFKCRIDQTSRGLKLSKINGSQRQAGLIFPDTERRGVFLGAMSIGSEPAATVYGGPDSERNIVGVVQRIGPAQWRLVQPWPMLESNLDLLELVPAG